MFSLNIMGERGKAGKKTERTSLKKINLLDNVFKTVQSKDIKFLIILHVKFQNARL